MKKESFVKDSEPVFVRYKKIVSRRGKIEKEMRNRRATLRQYESLRKEYKVGYEELQRLQRILGNDYINLFAFSKLKEDDEGAKKVIVKIGEELHILKNQYKTFQRLESQIIRKIKNRRERLARLRSK